MCLPTACCSRLRQTGAQLSRMDGSGLPRPGEERKHCFGPFRPSDLGFCPAVGTLLESQRASLEPVSGLAEALQGAFPQVPRPPGGPTGGGPGLTGREFFFGSGLREGPRNAHRSPPGAGANPRGPVEAAETLDRGGRYALDPRRTGRIGWSFDDSSRPPGTLVSERGLEPLRPIRAPGPQPGASAYSATPT